MSSKAYPYIGIGGQTKVIVLFYGHNKGAVIDGCGGGNSYRKYDVRYNSSESAFKNITREYLTNTYGKCESQEHADFICKLAKRHRIFATNDYHDGIGRVYFVCEKGSLSFFEALCTDLKLIHLPLPPKENDMESQLPTAGSGAEMPETKPTKPIYTKEMHERGELPPVGSEVETCKVEKVLEKNFKPSTDCVIDLWGSGCICEVVCHTDIGGQMLPVIKYNHQVSAVLTEFIKPIPTIEDELIHEFNNHLPLAYCKPLAQELLTKYNITPR